MQATVNPKNARAFAIEWHMLVVGVLTVTWYCLGLAYFGVTGSAHAGFAGWTQVFLASSLLGGLGGGVLLLLRSRWSLQAFVCALVGLMLASAKLFLLGEAPANVYSMPMMLGMWFITLPALYYASREHAEGSLR